MASPDSLRNIMRGSQKSLAQWQAFFFDRSVIQKAAGKAKLKAQSRMGAVVRRTAQTSMRYRKGPSAPGTPPSAHKSAQLVTLKKMGRVKYNGALLREMLYFAYDQKTQDTIVGPLGFKTRGTPIPALHEFGGKRAAFKGEVMAVKNPAGRDPTTGRFYSRGVQLVKLKGTLRYPARPFMRPALDKAIPKFAASFKGTVSR